MSDKFQWTDELVAEYSLSSQRLTMWQFKKSKEKCKELGWFVVPDDEFELGWEPIRQDKGNMGGYNGAEYFSSEEDAQKWIILNKPCLSIEEIAKIDLQSNSKDKPGFYYLLEELVKSKL